jgi:hypothetical protein
MILAAWLFGELVGGQAARRIVLLRESIAAALAGAVVDLVRRPRSTLVPGLATLLVLTLDVAAMLAAIAFLWGRSRVSLLDRTTDDLVRTLGLLAFLVAWTAGLALTGLIDAWRNAAATFEVVRRTVPADAVSHAVVDDDGTYGASTHRRPGDWSTGGGGGSL